jgi:RNA polymerase sigma-70 factor, ECF subfamily
MPNDFGPSPTERERTWPRYGGCEESLLQAYRSGEREALRLVESWIRRVVGRSSAELRRDRADVVQEVHLRLLSNLHRDTFRGESTFKTYVTSVTRYTSLALVRERRKYLPLNQEPDEMTSPGRGPDESLAVTEKGAFLRSAMRRLSAEHRRMFELVYCEGLDHEAVGRRLGIPVGTVKSRSSRFRAALTRQLATQPSWHRGAAAPSSHQASSPPSS